MFQYVKNTIYNNDELYIIIIKNNFIRFAHI